MAVTVDLDSYVTEADLQSFATDRGITLAIDPSVALIRAMDWLELQKFNGSKTDEIQPLEFPRNGSNAVPDKIETAQMVCAMIYNAGGDPLAVIGPQVTQKTVVGAVSISYADTGGSSRVFYPQLQALLADFVGSGIGGCQFEVTKV